MNLPEPILKKILQINTGKFIELKGNLAYLYLNLNQATEKL